MESKGCCNCLQGNPAGYQLYDQGDNVLDSKGVEGKDAQIVHTLQDKIIVEARTDIAEDVAVIMEECMKRPFKELFSGIPFKIEKVIQDTWGTID